ncbi:MAG: type I DNA topoisomerase [Bacteroidales bacterium]|nr:type I DNA topoisomerase [Bacteroidales bacterium]
MANSSKYQLVIVESPTKAKTIGQFLGPDFVVTSSEGHIRDLQKNNFGVDIEHDFNPIYVIPDEKKAKVEELKKLAKKAQQVWLASDEDREGEAISWHLAEVLELDEANTPRIVFHEITKNAILNAIKSPRRIDMNLVDAQQARRVLDRLVGFELSPVLWHKVMPKLSAGRVQSVAVRLLVDREREVIAFNAKSNFSTAATFNIKDPSGKEFSFKAELKPRFDNIDDAEAFMKSCASAQFSVTKVDSKVASRHAAPPFTTSTLQQEAGRSLGFSVKQTMQAAQRLYEAGFITYMRTDSVNLSEMALDAAQDYITTQWGANYHNRHQYTTKSKGAQEAHEAIRPTNFANLTAGQTAQEQKVYSLIWRRTVASQMADAKIEQTSISIASPDPNRDFAASAEVVVFDGFMKLYIEATDDDAETSKTVLPSVKAGDPLSLANLFSRERWTQRPPRYNEATLVSELEKRGIGRPSTYAPTISTIQDRGYVVKETREGQSRVYRTLSLTDGSVVRGEATETAGTERNKLFPTDVAMVVTDFLLRQFTNVMDYDFTANVEKQFDEVAEGELKWNKMIADFYAPFHQQVDLTMEQSQKNTGERQLGTDPKTGEPVSVRIGRFGPMAQIGETTDDGPKPRFASLRKDQHIETITLEQALRLFDLPRNVGKFEDKEVVISTGRFGPYVRHDGKFVSLKKEDDPYTITLEQAIERIVQKREDDKNKLIKEFPENADLKILNGRWGPYIAYGKANVKIPKGTDAAALSYDDCMKLCVEQDADPTKKKSRFAKASSASQQADSEPKTKSAAKPSKSTATHKTKKS